MTVSHQTISYDIVWYVESSKIKLDEWKKEGEGRECRGTLPAIRIKFVLSVYG